MTGRFPCLLTRTVPVGLAICPAVVGWYRKHVTLPTLDGNHVFITFGGVYKHARVWVNSNYLGMRAYGYSTFTFDITEFAVPGDNVVCVRCEHNDLADSRWFTGNGIYRDVALTIVSPTHFVRDGVFAYTESVSDKGAVIAVSAEVSGGGKASYLLKNALGRIVARGKTQLHVKEPELWSPGKPYLYTLVGTIERDGEAADEVCIPFGIRTFRFDANEGFFLNGINTKFKGVCIHHDAGVLGAAVPKMVWFRRLQKTKGMRLQCHPLQP